MNRRAMLPPPARHDLGLEPVLVHQPVGFQLDEPYLEARTDRARAYAIPVIDRALAGLARPTCVHLCFGYPQAHAQAGTTKVGGYAFLPELARCTAGRCRSRPRSSTRRPSCSASSTARRLEAALVHLPVERLVAAPDCGMKYLSRTVAFAKLQALAEGARRVA